MLRRVAAIFLISALELFRARETPGQYSGDVWRDAYTPHLGEEMVKHQSGDIEYSAAADETGKNRKKGK